MYVSQVRGFPYSLPEKLHILVALYIKILIGKIEICISTIDSLEIIELIDSAAEEGEDRPDVKKLLAWAKCKFNPRPRMYRVFIKYCVFFPKVLKYSGLRPFSVFPRCQCV